jgi:hypothetical protein
VNARCPAICLIVSKVTDRLLSFQAIKNLVAKLAAVTES